MKEQVERQAVVNASTDYVRGLTPYHSKYYAYELTKFGGDGVDRLTQSLLSAAIDLKPHQIEAALFALRSPLSKGVLLADEVGLGKTIEAGIVLCQFWAERKRRLLVLCPASLRKQWQVELEEKFNIPSLVVDAKSAREAVRIGVNPLVQEKIIISSYHYVWKQWADFKKVQWDIVVIDEAHKLRNAYRRSNRIGQAIRAAFDGRRKILLTATPFQNNLNELYGITTLISSDIFGDLATFRTQYTNAGGDLEELKQRLAFFCRRAHRNDDHVKTFINYTDRKLITVKYEPTQEEQLLYQDVTEFLRRQDLYSIPKRLSAIMLLGAHKVLASSPRALVGTLEHYKARLQAMLKLGRVDTGMDLIDCDVPLDEDEFEEAMESGETAVAEPAPALPEIPAHSLSELPFNASLIQTEINELECFISRVGSLREDTKTHYVLTALSDGWAKMRELGASEKAVIFTESRRSMEYLREFLEANGYADQVVCFSGGGRRDPAAEAIYQSYLTNHPDEASTGVSREVLIRHALIDAFRRDAKILIATEAGAEGINLQFCSLVINYDLPWNPQRIEQRIGRCHRYGQKFDVVIINFLNLKNAAEKRLLDLLETKYALFGTVFGVSDHVLVNRGEDMLAGLDGVESLEHKMLEIMKSCRTSDEINAAFDKLRDENKETVSREMRKASESVLSGLDEEVQRHLRIEYDCALNGLSDSERMFWRLTCQTLDGQADFYPEDLSFRLSHSPSPSIASGLYRLRHLKDEFASPFSPSEILYRFNSPLADWCLGSAKSASTPCREVSFDLTAYGPNRIAALKPYIGKSGWLALEDFRIDSLDAEEHLLFSGVTDDGASLPPDLLPRLFELDAAVGGETVAPADKAGRLDANREQLSRSTLLTSESRAKELFNEEYARLNRWQEDCEAVETRKIAQLMDALRIADRDAHLATTIEAKAAAGRQATELEKQLRAARVHLFKVSDEARAKTEEVVRKLEAKLVQKTGRTPLFVIRWKLV